MTVLSSQISQLALELRTQEPLSILRFALENIKNIAIAFSGAEDVVLIDMAVQLDKKVRVFCIDTGRLHPETYQFMEKVRQHYKINLEILFPDAKNVADFVLNKGLFSFYEDGHTGCCQIRKVQPLQQYLSTLDGWITGQRRDQSPGTRSQVEVIEKDMSFSTDERSLIKFNPLALWTSNQVWDYILTQQVPYNTLHAQGFKSIGCAPCTRSVLPGQHEREGRWWWESTTAKECGLHQNTKLVKESV